MASKVDPYHLNNAIELANGKINFEEYSNRREIYSKVKLYEVKELLLINTLLYQQYLLKLPFNLRPKAIKEIHDLTNVQIRFMGPEINGQETRFSGQMDDYLAGNYNSDSSVGKDFYRLCIILDTPLDYLKIQNPLSSNVNNLSEYLYAAERKNLKDILLNLTRPNTRIIRGYVINEALNDTIYLNTEIRVDRKVEYYCVEIFLYTLNSIDVPKLVYLMNELLINVKYVLVSNTLLRDRYKLLFFGTYDNYPLHENELKTHLNKLQHVKYLTQIYPDYRV
ncbi:hypothetical protein [Oceanobacillus kimchii]|uniref:hypothetical protein n=1 Tax=Oceanobacillus kimchii TaxID=746691 RepID=UPI003C71D3E2